MQKNRNKNSAIGPFKTCFLGLITGYFESTTLKFKEHDKFTLNIRYKRLKIKKRKDYLRRNKETVGDRLTEPRHYLIEFDNDRI